MHKTAIALGSVGFVSSIASIAVASMALENSEKNKNNLKTINENGTKSINITSNSAGALKLVSNDGQIKNIVSEGATEDDKTIFLPKSTILNTKGNGSELVNSFGEIKHIQMIGSSSNEDTITLPVTASSIEENDSISLFSSTFLLRTISMPGAKVEGDTIVLPNSILKNSEGDGMSLINSSQEIKRIQMIGSSSNEDTITLPVTASSIEENDSISLFSSKFLLRTISMPGAKVEGDTIVLPMLSNFDTDADSKKLYSVADNKMKQIKMLGSVSNEDTITLPVLASSETTDDSISLFSSQFLLRTIKKTGAKIEGDVIVLPDNELPQNMEFTAIVNGLPDDVSKNTFETVSNAISNYASSNCLNLLISENCNMGSVVLNANQTLMLTVVVNAILSVSTAVACDETSIISFTGLDSSTSFVNFEDLQSAASIVNGTVICKNIRITTAANSKLKDMTLVQIENCDVGEINLIGLKTIVRNSTLKNFEFFSTASSLTITDCTLESLIISGTNLNFFMRNSVISAPCSASCDFSRLFIENSVFNNSVTFNGSFVNDMSIIGCRMLQNLSISSIVENVFILNSTILSVCNISSSTLTNFSGNNCQIGTFELSSASVKSLLLETCNFTICRLDFLGTADEITVNNCSSSGNVQLETKNDLGIVSNCNISNNKFQALYVYVNVNDTTISHNKIELDVILKSSLIQDISNVSITENTVKNSITWSRKYISDKTVQNMINVRVEDNTCETIDMFEDSAVFLKNGSNICKNNVSTLLQITIVQVTDCFFNHNVLGAGKSMTIERSTVVPITPITEMLNTEINNNICSILHITENVRLKHCQVKNNILRQNIQIGGTILSCEIDGNITAFDIVLQGLITKSSISNNNCSKSITINNLLVESILTSNICDNLTISSSDDVFDNLQITNNRVFGNIIVTSAKGISNSSFSGNKCTSLNLKSDNYIKNNTLSNNFVSTGLDINIVLVKANSVITGNTISGNVISGGMSTTCFSADFQDLTSSISKNAFTANILGNTFARAPTQLSTNQQNRFFGNKVSVSPSTFGNDWNTANNII
jgi:hypothetical protein